MANKKNMTMAEFAELIGLSRPTLSRYFNNPDSVRSKTRKDIEKALEKYNFSPNFLAAGLNRGRTKAIGIVIPSIIDSFYSAFVSGIEKAAEESGYITMLQSSHNEPKRERRGISRLLSMDVTGIIVAPLGYNSDVEEILKASERMPVVIADSRLTPELPYVGTDNNQSVSILVDYLCRSGTPPALFTMPAMNINVVERREAYCKRMSELGHEPKILNQEEHAIGDDYERYGYERFLTLGPDKLEGVRSILCPNDRVAFGILSAAAKLGLKVGTGENDDLRVAGHDGQHFGAFTYPALTTAAQDIDGMATIAVEAILAGKTHRAFKEDILLTAKFIGRDSA